jgi:hypothetical protein
MIAPDSHHQLKIIAVIDILVLTLGIVGAVGTKKIFSLEISGALNDGHPGFLSLQSPP